MTYEPTLEQIKAAEAAWWSFDENADFTERFRAALIAAEKAAPPPPPPPPEQST